MAELERGAVFAGHRIEGVAGRGGFGVVYRATHLALDHVVALKLISTGRASDETFRDRFKSESRIAVSIRHPNVVAVHNAGEEEGLLFVTMDFIDGTDLRGLLNREGRLEPDRAVAITGRVAAALDAAHERGLVHRDIKPGNVLIEQRDGEEHVYLTDFGLSKQMDATSGVTASGAFVGTLDYVAPEQIRGDRLDARTDVYALGCVVFELLSGQVPFEQEEKVAKIYAHLQEEPPELVDAAPEVPPALSDVVWRAMAKDPDARQPSAGDFARAAGAALEGRSPSEPERSVGVGAAAPTQAYDLLAEEPPTVEAQAGETTIQEPVTVPPAPEPSADRGAVRPTSRAAGRGRLLAMGVVAVALVVGAFVLLGGDDEGSGGRGAGDGGGGEEAAGPTEGVVATVPGEEPVGIAVGGGEVWVSSRAGESLAHLPVDGSEKPEDIKLPGEGEQVAIDSDGKVWLAVGGPSEVEAGQVIRFNPDGSEDARFTVGAEPRGIGVGEEAAWVANLGDDSVSRIDRDTGEVTPISLTSGSDPARVAVGQPDNARGIWVTNSATDSVARITDEGTTVEYIEAVGANPRGVAVGDDSVWVANQNADQVVRIDPDSMTVAETIDVGDDPRSLAVGFGSVWTTNGLGESVSRIDEETGDETQITSKPDLEGIAVDQQGVWVTSADDRTVSFIEP